MKVAINQKNIFRTISVILLGILFFSGIKMMAREKNKLSFWNFNYLHGYLGLESNYYYQNTTMGSGFTDTQKSKQFNGSFSLDTKSNIIHPNFLELELNLLLRPDTRSDDFIVAPDQAATTTAEKISFRTNLFNQRPLSGSFYYNYDHSFVRRDFATNIENIRKNIGAFINFRSYIANFNFNFNYNYDDWLQNEIDLKRFYASKIHNFSANISQSYKKSYENKLSVSYLDYSRLYSYNQLFISNQTFDSNLKTKFNFEFYTPVQYFSFIAYNKQVGYDKRNKFSINQSFSTQFPYNFTLDGNYNYNYLKVDLFLSKINRANLNLNHKLFNSLNTFVKYTFSNFQQNSLTEKTNDLQIGFDYTKNIPYGNIRLSYKYGHYNKSTKSLSNVSSIFSEPHTLTDGSIELLYNPNVFNSTIVITDEENILVYQEGFDYEIIEHGEFFEIKRMLGGQIPNNGTVFVNYDFFRDNSFKYTSPNHNFLIGLNLFDNLIQLSYSGMEVSFNNLENVRYIVLQLISQRILSLTFNYAGFSTGIEFNSFKSNIVPYESLRYFGQYDYLMEKFGLFSFIANYKTLDLTEQYERQTFMDVVGRAIFFLSLKSKIVFESSYQFQEGISIDLDLLKFKTEFQINYRATQIFVGVELFDRTYIQETRKYFNGYVSIQRNF